MVLWVRILSGIRILLCEEAIQLALSVVLLRCPLVSEIMNGGAPDVFLHL